MKFDVRKIVAIVLTLALVFTTITFTAGNSLKAEGLGEGAEGSSEASQEVTLDKQDSSDSAKADSTDQNKDSVTGEEEEEPEEAAPVVKEEKLAVLKDNSGNHKIKLFVNKGVSIGLSEFVLEGNTYTAEGTHYNTNGSTNEGLSGTHKIYDVNKKELGTLSLVPHSGGNGHDSEKGTDNYDITGYTPVPPPTPQTLSLTLSTDDLRAVYDGNVHKVTVTPSVKEGTTLYYQVFKGTIGESNYELVKDWSTDEPSLTDVGSCNVLVKAENAEYGTAFGKYCMKVSQKHINIDIPNRMQKNAGDPDPEILVTMTELVPKDQPYKDELIEYTLQKTYGDGYIGVKPTGKNDQGNYYVHYGGGNIIIVKGAQPLAINVEGAGFEGTYDGQSHGGSVTVTKKDGSAAPKGTVVEYSIDNGETWTEKAPTVKDVNESTTVQVRATCPDFTPATGEYELTVTPKAITVKAEDKTKVKGEKDPEFTVDVTDLVDKADKSLIKYEIGREQGEAVKTYTITPSGDATQGNYAVSYETGTLTIIDKLVLESKPYNGTYDGQEHSGTVGPKDAAIENIKYQYSLDGEKWTDTEPSFKDAGNHTYYVKGTADGYGPSDVIEVKVNIAKKALKITTPSDTKKYDGTALTNDKVKVEGLVEGEYFSIAVTGSQTEVGYSNNTVEYAFGTVEDLKAAEAAKANYDISVELGVLTVTEADAEEPTPTPAPAPGNNGGNGGNNTVLVAQGTADDGAALTEVATEKTPLASTLLDDNCCILHLMIILAALIMLFWYTTDMKRRQRRIFELEEEINSKE